jgi:hypothetical protein
MEIGAFRGETTERLVDLLGADALAPGWQRILDRVRTSTGTSTGACADRSSASPKSSRSASERPPGIATNPGA